ncbi:AAA family ATPase, partial [Ruminococcus sp.]|uniref:ATP-binding protein n=1 Tax=Ruminococcus sp. TaxID=41978 RepID=UPI003F801387
MFIKEFKIKNFRNFDDAGVLLKFHQGVNAIVGENNAGKSAIISAIRIAVSIIQYKKDIYFTKSDFHLDAKGVLANEAQFDIYLADVPKYLIEIWKPGTDEGEFHIRFFLIKNEAGKERIKYSVWGGEAEGNQLSADTLEAINLVYLGALRDAENEMRPNRNSKIANLLGALAATPELKEDLVNELVKANNALLQKEPISKIREIINRNLVSIEHDVLHQQIDIGFIDPKFDSIAASLRTWILPRWSFVDKTSKYFTRIKERCSTHKDLVDEDAEGIFLDVKKYSEIFREIDEEEKLYLKEISKFSFDLFQNGLGYNNLLFISTVLG